MDGGKQFRPVGAGGFPPYGKHFRRFSTPWKTAAAQGRAAYFLTGRGGWVFFIQASWTIIMTWLVDQ